MKKDQFLFLDMLGQIDDTFIEASSQPWKEEKAETGENRSRTPRRGFLHVRRRWHIAAVMIPLVAMSMAVLANDDIREGLLQLRLQFFSDNVTIDSVQEGALQQTDSPEEETIVDEKESKNIILDIPSTADFLYNCSTVEELKAHSDLIIKATVKEANAWVDESATIGTEYTLEVDKCYFGDTKDTITVNNLGGIILASKYFEKQDDSKMDEVKKKIEANPDDSYVRFQFDGAWQPEEGKQYIWFLESYEENGVVDYTPINVYEGVYEVDENIVERYTSENMSGATTRSSQPSDDRMELSEMESRIIG